MGYYNLIYQSGENNFLKNCSLSGVDGLIIVDLPYPENHEFAKKCKKKSINFIQLLSPTTSKERMKKIKDTEMFIYINAVNHGTMPKEILKIIIRLKINRKNLVIGFGITDKTISALKLSQL